MRRDYQAAPFMKKPLVIVLIIFAAIICVLLIADILVHHPLAKTTPRRPCKMPPSPCSRPERPHLRQPNLRLISDHQFNLGLAHRQGASPAAVAALQKSRGAQTRLCGSVVQWRPYRQCRQADDAIAAFSKPQTQTRYRKRVHIGVACGSRKLLSKPLQLPKGRHNQSQVRRRLVQLGSP